MSVLDEVLRSQRQHQRPKFQLSDTAQVVILSAVAFGCAAAYIGIAHHRFIIPVYVFERQNIAFAVITAPIAFLAGLLRFSVRSAAIVVASGVTGACLSLFLALSSGRGWSVFYDVLSLNLQNAFWQFPNVALNVLVAVLFSGLAWIAGLLLMDYCKPLA